MNSLLQQIYILERCDYRDELEDNLTQGIIFYLLVRFKGRVR